MNLTRRIFQNDASIIINKTRSAYTGWARKNRLSYYELLVLGVLHKAAPCTQKQICGVCGLPKQTVNRITSALVKAGHLEVSPVEGNKKEKNLNLTEEGKEHIAKVLVPLQELEQAAIRKMGEDAFQMFLDMIQLYRISLEAEILNLEYSK
ncbi:MAG: MarR family transcriptional regulator [Firmicutes bacterium]|nr:MarR family transcriptional regulator [Bacillota bacterium]